MNNIETQRLLLIPLTREQLVTGLTSIDDVSGQVGFPIVRNLIEGNTERAIKIKVEKMAKNPVNLHPWFTYWLIVIKSESIGAGLVGYKGSPDIHGEVEIGYGIDPQFRRQGFMTEAVIALVEWAFSHPDCRVVVAPGVKIWNTGSQKVLTTAGFSEVSRNNEGVDYRLEKSQ